MRLDLDKLLTLEVQQPRWVVEHIVPAATLVMVAGDAGVGKSVMNLTEAFHIALGRPFFGRPTVQGRVLYFDEENSRPDISAYLQQIWIGMGQPDKETLKQNFRLEHFSLGVQGWGERMLALSKEFNPSILYLDTATSALDIQDENNNAEAQRACNQLRRIVDDTEAHPAVKILKHAKYASPGGSKKEKGKTRRTIRGAKAWKSAVDQSQFHIRAPGAPTKEGLHTTYLVSDKRRAYGLRGNIKIIPRVTGETPNGLILQGEDFDSPIDLMME